MHKLGISLYCDAKNLQNSRLRSNKSQVLNSLQQKWCSYGTLLQQNDLQIGVTNVQNSLIFARYVQHRSKLACLVQGSGYWLKQSRGAVHRCFNHGVENSPHLTRNFLAQLWIAEKKMIKYREKRRPKFVKCKGSGEKVYHNPSSFQHALGRWFAGSAVPDKKYYEGDKTLKQPPVGQSISGFLKPTSREEANNSSCMELAITQQIPSKP